MICPHCGKETSVDLSHFCLLRIKGEEKEVVKSTQLLFSTKMKNSKVYNRVRHNRDEGVEDIMVVHYRDKQ